MPSTQPQPSLPGVQPPATAPGSGRPTQAIPLPAFANPAVPDPPNPQAPLAPNRPTGTTPASPTPSLDVHPILHPTSDIFRLLEPHPPGARLLPDAALMRAMPDLDALLPADPRVRREHVAEALTWLVEHIDQPPLVASRAADLGPALQQLGVTPQRLDAMGVLMADAVRAAGGPALRAEHQDAWRTTAKHVARWMGEGMNRLAYEPPFWTANVVAHERRGAGIAVLRLRTYLPYHWYPGQYATIESPRRPGQWGQFWIANMPVGDHELVVHAHVEEGDEVAAALVRDTVAGDRLRLRPARGGLPVDPDSGRDVLLVAHDVGIAPMEAVLSDLARYRTVRGVHLLWSVDDEADFYDLDEVRELAGPGVVIEGVVVDGSAGPLTDAVARRAWNHHDVYVTGSAESVGAAVAALEAAEVPRERIHGAALEPWS
jgi:NAD(P)H-flavin reductase